MTYWKINPGGVQAVLTGVGTAADDLGEELTEAKFQGVLDALVWANVLTGDVPVAVNAVFADQGTNLNVIVNRIRAGTVGVANAVIAYNDGQEQMAATFQAQAVASSTSGDFSFFDQYGYQG